MEDSLSFEHLMNAEEPVPLMEAVRAMQGLSFWDGSRRRERTFDYDMAKEGVRVCFTWAESERCPEDAKRNLTVDQRAALRAWTCTPLCYVLTSALRNAQPTLESLRPVLPYARLLFSALHNLPEKYNFKRGTLYRAEDGVRATWDAEMRAPGGIFSFYALTSCSTQPQVLRSFKGEGARTVYILRDASGSIIKDFSDYKEDEVLLEPVCHFQVLRAEKYDESHPDVLMGEVREGLHKVEGRLKNEAAMAAAEELQARRRRRAFCHVLRVWQNYCGEARKIKEEAEERKIKQRLRRSGRCSGGFDWFKCEGGWRCHGGSHWVSNADLVTLT